MLSVTRWGGVGAAGEAALEPVPEPPGLKEAVGPRHQEVVGVGLLPDRKGWATELVWCQGPGRCLREARRYFNPLFCALVRCFPQQ